MFQLGSSRPIYWHQAIDVGEHALFKGVGLLGFAVARLRYTTNLGVVSEAHGYLFETFADLGLLGVVAHARAPGVLAGRRGAAARAPDSDLVA